MATIVCGHQPGLPGGAQLAQFYSCQHGTLDPLRMDVGWTPSMALRQNPAHRTLQASKIPVVVGEWEASQTRH